jgi:hypothetical protein
MSVVAQADSAGLESSPEYPLRVEAVEVSGR